MSLSQNLRENENEIGAAEQKRILRQSILGRRSITNQAVMGRRSITNQAVGADHDEFMETDPEGKVRKILRVLICF